MPNYSLISHESIASLCGALMGIGALVIGLRFYARRKQQVTLKVDDWLVLPAYAFFVGVCITMFVGIQHKVIGWPDNPDTMELWRGLKFTDLLFYSFDILATFSFGFTKASALFFYYRIFCPRGICSPFGTVVIAGVVVVTLWTILFATLLPLQCGTHFSATWTLDPVARQKYCSGGFEDVEGWTTTDMILDFLIILLPVPSIFRLNMSMRRKLGIIGVFLFAFVGFGASVTRMAMVISVIHAIKVGAKAPVSSNFESQIQFYTILSGGMCLIAVNLPSLWLLFSKGRVPEKVLYGVRSFVSLRSLSNSISSKYSKRSRDRDHPTSRWESQDKSYLVNQVNPEAGGYMAYSMSDVQNDLESVKGSGEEVPPVPPFGNILVKESVIQSSHRR